MSLRPLLLGHRGLRGDKTISENTAAAFGRALDEGCDGFELDVRLTSAGRLVICHDEKANGVVVSRAGANELRDLPDLPSVLRLFGGRAFLDIELKVGGLEEQVVAALRESPPQRGYVVSSFLPEVLREMKARAGDVPLGIICETRRQLAEWEKLPVEYVIVEQALADSGFVETLHKAARKVFVWTVNDVGAITRLAGWGVDGLVGDSPRGLVGAFAAGET